MIGRDVSDQQSRGEALWRQEEYSGERDMERFWAEVAPRNEPLRRKWFLPLLVLILLLLGGSLGGFWGILLAMPAAHQARSIFGLARKESAKFSNNVALI